MGLPLIPDPLRGAAAQLPYDPRRLSPLAVTNLIRAASMLAATAEGAADVPHLLNSAFVQQLRADALAMRRELERVGALLPRDGARP